MVLRTSEYKEADAMVNAINEDGFLSFSAKGAKRLLSKNAPSIQPFSLSEFVLMESASGGKTLKSGSLEENLALDGDVASMVVDSFFQEATLRIVQEDEAPLAYPFLLEALQNIKAGGEPLSQGLCYFAKVLCLGGYGLDVDECAVCHGKRAIVGLSFEEGGFLCENDFPGAEGERLSPMRLKIVRFLFRCAKEDFKRANFERNDSIFLYQKLDEYLQLAVGTHLKSISLIKRI